MILKWEMLLLLYLWLLSPKFSECNDFVKFGFNLILEDVFLLNIMHYILQ